MKRDNVDRHAVPEDRLERFMGLIYSLVEPFGIDDVPEVYHYVELLGQAIERQIVESKFNGGASQNRLAADRRKFIAIFKNRYVLMTDLEYTRSITGVDGKMIGQLIGVLSDKGFDVDEYLAWLFDDYLPANQMFCPPTMKFACGALAVEKFLFLHRDEIKQRREEQVRKKESLDLIARARVLIRIFANDDGVKKKIVEMLKGYRDGSIIIEKVREEIEAIEKVARENPTVQQEAQQAGDGHGAV